MAEYSARDVTDAKREARDEHIGEHGRANAATIFSHIPDVLGIDGWEEAQHDDFEHVWKHEKTGAVAYMYRDSGLWHVKLANSSNWVLKMRTFQFSGKKHAEAKMLTFMDQYQQTLQQKVKA
jgi:hypothetical protein